jgi:hypothetical protein
MVTYSQCLLPVDLPPVRVMLRTWLPLRLGGLTKILLLDYSLLFAAFLTRIIGWREIAVPFWENE